MKEDSRYSTITISVFSQALSFFLQEQKLMTEEIKEKYDSVVLNILDSIIPLVLKEISETTNDDPEQIADPSWMIELANRSVQINTQENGMPKYNSAQGYACALTAIKMMSKYISKKPQLTDEIKTDSKDEDQKELILKNAKEIYRHLSSKFGKESAARQALVYIGEQYQVLDWNDINLSPNEEEDFLNKVISKLEE